VIALGGGYQQLELPDSTDRSRALELSHNNSVVIRISGVYLVEFELAVRYATGVDLLRLELCVNGDAVPNYFVERDVSALPESADDTKPSLAREVRLHGKGFLPLNSSDILNLRIYAPSEGSIETNDGQNSILLLLLVEPLDDIYDAATDEADAPIEESIQDADIADADSDNDDATAATARARRMPPVGQTEHGRRIRR
jgi:hypothetical protein